MKIVKVLSVLALVMGASGCAGPRYVTNSTASKGTVKFLWVEDRGASQGIVKCEMAENGDLQNCRDVKVALEEN